MIPEHTLGLNVHTNLSYHEHYERDDFNETRKTGFNCEGTIPGSVYSFLLNNSLMEYSYYRQNELKPLQLAEYDYTFTRNFDFDTSLKAPVLL